MSKLGSFRKHFKELKCELCGNSDERVLCVHHKIGRDNYSENLMLLCANCHLIVHDCLRRGIGGRIVEVELNGFRFKKMFDSFVCFNCLRSGSHLMPLLSGNLKNCYVCVGCYDRLLGVEKVNV